jgi:hypothetical protein
LAPNLSEYKHSDILVLIIFDCRQSNAKDADDSGRASCLKAGLILAGILVSFISLTGVIISIYLLTMINTSTTTTGKNKILLFKLKVHIQTSFLSLLIKMLENLE